MPETVILHEWAMFAVRWAHLIAVAGWIGASFYFIALDLGLIHRPHLPDGVKGEEWQVHGGGFYHVQKYMVAPPNMPEHLVWFKWDSYATFLSGFALLVLLYYVGADLHLIDNTVMELSVPAAIAISVASLAFGWLLYDTLCRMMEGQSNSLLMLILFLILVGLSWGYAQLFSGRAALLHLGALTGSIMTGNVFFRIMPNQRITVADLKAGRTPDARYGIIAKQRSTHNNYLTLPVFFLMLSSHYPLAFATDYSWIIACLVFLMGVTIRIWFNTWAARGGKPWWTWAVTLLLFAGVIALSIAGSSPAEEEEGGEQAFTPTARKYAAHPGFEQVVEIVQLRCSMCHAAEPGWDGIIVPPRQVKLETEAQIAAQARDIYLQAGRTRAMPPGNLTEITGAERRLLIAWYEGRGGF